MTASYQQRAADHTARRDVEMRRSIMISRARLTIFILATATLIGILAQRGGIAWYALDSALFVAFGVLVVWHARVENRVQWHDALRIVAVRGAARVQRRWEDLPPGHQPASIDLTHHPYAIDLDLFGRASLFQPFIPTSPMASTDTSGTISL